MHTDIPEATGPTIREYYMIHIQNRIHSTLSLLAVGVLLVAGGCSQSDDQTVGDSPELAPVAETTRSGDTPDESATDADTAEKATIPSADMPYVVKVVAAADINGERVESVLDGVYWGMTSRGLEQDIHFSLMKVEPGGATLEGLEPGQISVIISQTNSDAELLAIPVAGDADDAYAAGVAAIRNAFANGQE